METTKLIRMHRAKKGYSQEYIGQHFGLTKASISYYETDKRVMSLVFIKKLVELLDIPKNDMIKALREDHKTKSKEEWEKMLSEFMED